MDRKGSFFSFFLMDLNPLNGQNGQKGGEAQNDRRERTAPERKAGEVAEDIKQEVDKYVDSAKEYWEDFTDGAKRKKEIAKEGLNRAKEKADKVAHQSPWQLVGLAALAGAALGVALGACKKSRCRWWER